MIYAPGVGSAGHFIRYFDLSANWLWADLGADTTFRLQLLFFFLGVSKTDFDPSLLQVLLLSSVLSHWVPQAGGGESSTQLGNRPFFFKEDKEVAGNLYGFLYPDLPHVCFV